MSNVRAWPRDFLLTRCLRLATWFLLVPGAVVPCHAQPTETDSTAIRNSFTDIKRNTMLHLQLVDGRIIEGPYDHTSMGYLLLKDSEKTRVPLELVDALWVRAPTSGKKITIGIALGAIVGGLVAVNSWPILGNPRPVFAIGAFAGVLVGGTVGKLFGFWTREWEQRYP